MYHLQFRHKQEIRTLTWTVGANTCTGSANQTVEGANRTVVSNSANTGSATYTCSGNDYVNSRNLSCVAPAPAVAANGITSGTSGCCPPGQYPQTSPSGYAQCQTSLHAIASPSASQCANGGTFTQTGSIGQVTGTCSFR